MEADLNYISQHLVVCTGSVINSSYLQIGQWGGIKFDQSKLRKA